MSRPGRVRRALDETIKRARKLAEVDPAAVGLARTLADRIDVEPDSTRLAALAGRLEQQRQAILAPALAVEAARARQAERQTEPEGVTPSVVDDVARARSERRRAAGLPPG